MSVAFDLDPHMSPQGSAPAPARAPVGVPTGPDRPRLATVTTLHRPSPGSVAPPVRLTRRGVHAAVLAVAALALGVVALAWLSAPAAPPAPRATPDTVVVRSGDTLWRIAGRIAPDRDPLAEIDALRRVNHLGGSDLYPGQVLRTH
jgi:Tfp pilus assembly protein FimV